MALQQCEQCNKPCRKGDLYLTIEKPKGRYLCADCFWNWVGIENPNRRER